MKDYKTIGMQICNFGKFSEICQCGTPTPYIPVNLCCKICEPYIIGYAFYVAYDAFTKRWSIDYSIDEPLTNRSQMQHIKGIKTDKEMYAKVNDILEELRKRFQIGGYSFLRELVESEYDSLIKNEENYPGLNEEETERMSMEFLNCFAADLIEDEVATEKQVRELFEASNHADVPLKIIYADMILFCLGKEFPMVVKSNNVYSPQNYLEAVTGNCYFFNTSKPILEQITDILKANKQPIENYLLCETEKVVTKNEPVILVDCCDVKDNKDPVKEYRWFRVPMDFKD